MSELRSLDHQVRARLRQWPQRPPGLVPPPDRDDYWLRGRPSETCGSHFPFLKLPGSTRLRTLPDGLWLNFGGTPEEPFVDIFCVEACSSLTNLLDKRSRFAPSTHSLLAVCPVPWLLSPVAKNDPTPRWQVTGVCESEPVRDLVMPVRDVKVMYALNSHHYQGFAKHQIAHAHEYFVPMDAITAEDCHENPAIRALVARSAVSANFLGAA